jgi:hypothetical protein
MDLFVPIVQESAQHPNFKRVLLHPPSHKAVLQQWATGFQDRDNKFVKEFQISFNPSFWELYIFACLKELRLGVDFTHTSPDFVVTSGFLPCSIECVTAQNAYDKKPEHALTIEDRLQDLHGPSREDVAYEATVRLANAISSKYAHYTKLYSTLSHVRGKPFLLAVAPFEEPYFWIQRLDGIGNVLYQLKLKEVKKKSGAVIPLGFFLDNSMPEISAVLFSNVATFSKVVALANDSTSINHFITARHGHQELDQYSQNYEETLLDGLFVMHNPHALCPVSRLNFQLNGLAQVYGMGQSIMADFPYGYLLERSCFTGIPK